MKLLLRNGRQVLLMLPLFLAMTAKGANWYVDNASAGGNGTSWASAWSSLSSIVWGSSGVKAGDTLYISGGSSGKTYSGNLSVGAGGSTTSRVTIRVGQEAGHNGVVTISGNIVCSQGYVTIDGGYNGARHLVLASGRYADFTTAVDPKLLYTEISNTGLGVVATYGTKGEFAYCKITGITTDAAIRLNARNQGVAAYDQTFIHHNEIQVNSLSNNGNGPDGIQTGWGVSFYNNIIYGQLGGTVTGGEHQDLIQTYGTRYHKFYNNIFYNGADSMIGCDSSPSNVRIWGNVFFSTYAAGTCAIRFYNSTTYSEILIDNNTFVDLALQNNYGAAIQMTGSSASGCTIRNNIFYNCGRVYQVIQLNGISGMTIDYNLFNAGAHGNTSILYGGFSGQAHGQTGVPQFVSYAEGSLNNNYHLRPSDTAAMNRGTDLSTLFTVDQDGIARGADGAWEIGAYELNGAPSTNPIISINPTSLDFGTIASGATKDLTFTVRNTGAGTLSGSATVSSPFSILSGGTYSLGSNQSQTVTVRYNPAAAGGHVQNVIFSGGGGTSAIVSGSAFAMLPGLSFESYAGTITSPFITNSAGYISQSAETSLTGSGQAVYGFTITTPGSYTIVASVNAPSDAANSMFVNIDGQPTDPAMIWDIPITSGFAPQAVSWRGSGTFDNPQYVPAVFNLTAGAHQLIVRGREGGVQLGRITIAPVGTAAPSPPQNLRVTASL